MGIYFHTAKLFQHARICTERKYPSWPWLITNLAINFWSFFQSVCCNKLLNEISVVNLHDKYTLVLILWHHLLLPQEHHIKVVWRNYKHIQGLWSNESVYFWEVYQIEELGTRIAFYSKLSSVLTAAFPDPLISTVMVTISLGCTHSGLQLS